MQNAMKTNPKQAQSDKLSQLGGTDQIEQEAADLAKKDHRSKTTNQDREEAMRQMKERAPAPDPEKSGTDAD